MHARDREFHRRLRDQVRAEADEERGLCVGDLVAEGGGAVAGGEGEGSSVFLGVSGVWWDGKGWGDWMRDGKE